MWSTFLPPIRPIINSSRFTTALRGKAFVQRVTCEESITPVLPLIPLMILSSKTRHKRKLPRVHTCWRSYSSQFAHIYAQSLSTRFRRSGPVPRYHGCLTTSHPVHGPSVH